MLIIPLNVEVRGDLCFHAEDMPRIHGYVFTASDYEGTPTETEEAIPMWFSVTDIPYIEMWEDDKCWLPQVIAGQVVDAWFIFAGESVLDHKVTIREV